MVRHRAYQSSTFCPSQSMRIFKTLWVLFMCSAYFHFEQWTFWVRLRVFTLIYLIFHLYLAFFLPLISHISPEYTLSMLGPPAASCTLVQWYGMEWYGGLSRESTVGSYQMKSRWFPRPPPPPLPASTMSWRLGSPWAGRKHNHQLHQLAIY